MLTAQVIKPGLLTTVQDLGRFGHRHVGVPVSGALDRWALLAANAMVGNEPGAACLELTIRGPVIRFLRGCLAAVTGADMGPLLGGRPVPMWESFFCAPNDILSFGYSKSGCRSYLAISGGIDVPRVMGSRSTLLTAGLGGYHGRRLKEGDIIGAGEAPADTFFIRKLPEHLRPAYVRETRVKVIRGINVGCFPEEEYAGLFAGPFTVSARSDRMGCMLENGARIREKTDAGKESYPVVPGSIQVLPAGNPVILLNDAQSTGGYAQIACVASAELWKIAQAVPGDRVRFEEIDMENACQLLKNKHRDISGIQHMTPARLYSKTDKNIYEILVQNCPETGKI